MNHPVMLALVTAVIAVAAVVVAVVAGVSMLLWSIVLELTVR